MAADPVAIVTAAGRGIGEAIARELHSRGYRLSLMSPSGSSKRLAHELGGIGLNGSITQASDLKELVERSYHEYGRIDAVVNNSGRYADVLGRLAYDATTGADPLGFETLTTERLGYDPDYAPDILSIPDSAWLESYELHVLGTIRMARLVTPYMEKAGYGAIVNISGMEAREPRQIFPLGPNRLTLHGFTKLFADRYARCGIRMNSLMPGMVENAHKDATEVARVVPMGRCGRMGELAKTVAFLLSDDAGYITGQTILADGGLNRAVH